MTTGDIVLDLLYEIAINIGAEELREFLRKVLSGEDPEQLAASGDPAAQFVQSSFADVGIDLDTVSSQQWEHYDAVSQEGFEGGLDDMPGGISGAGHDDLLDPSVG